DAESGDLIGSEAQERSAPEAHRSLFGHVEAREDVEERGLARAVGPDDGGDAAFLEDEVDLVQRDQPAESLGDAARLEKRCHQGSAGSWSSRVRRRAGRMPCGRKIIMSTRMRPKIMRSYLAGSSWVGRLARLQPRIMVPALRSSLSQREKP